MADCVASRPKITSVDIIILIEVLLLLVYSWLLHDPEMEPRSMYHPFIEATERYFQKLLPILVPLQVFVNDQ